MDRLGIVDHSDILELVFDDLKKFHGTRSICGLTVSFKVMQAAWDALASGAPIKRSELSVSTAFPGPGARDGFEMVMRAVTREKYWIEKDITPSDQIAEAAKGAYYFRITGNGRVAELGLKPEVVPSEFVPLRRRQLQGELSDDEQAAFRHLQLTFSEELLSMSASNAVNLLSIDDDRQGGDTE